MALPWRAPVVELQRASPERRPPTSAPLSFSPRSTLAFLVAYVAAMALGRVFTLESTGLALFWPAAGVAALWLIRDSTRAELVTDAVALFVVSTAFFGLVTDSGLATSVLLGVANVLQALVVRLVLARLSGRTVSEAVHVAVTDVRSLRHLVVAAVLAALAGAPVGVWASWAGPGDLSWSTAVNWFLRNACGILVVAAAVLAVLGTRDRTGGQGWRARLTAEERPRAIHELATAVVLTVVLGAVVVATPGQIPVTYLMMGTSAWVGFRFTPAVGGVYTLGFGTLAVLLTLGGRGPFGAVDDLALRANSIQLFVAMTTLLVLLLADGVASRAQLAAQLRQVEGRATTRADLLDAVNGAMVDGLCVSDSWGHVLLANAAAAELGGADEHGAHAHDSATAQWFWADGSAIDPEDLPHARALRGETVELSDVIRRDTATGQEKVLAVSAVPLHFGTQDPSEVEEAGPLAVVLMRDVTWRRAQQRAQENFVAVVAHDLKGPVAGVMSWAEMAQDQVRSGGQGDLVEAELSIERIRRTAVRMNALITDLLDFTLASSAQLHATAVDLDELVDVIVADLERPDGDVLVEHPSLGVVEADALLVRQLFGNLVANAVKYVAPGVSPHIRITSSRTGDSLEITVSDNGIGIPEHDRSRIFESFYRSAEAKAIPGSGLGLAICRHAVERHGGWIAAREGPGGVGTSVVFTLPVVVPVGDPLGEPVTRRESDPDASSAAPV